MRLDDKWVSNGRYGTRRKAVCVGAAEACAEQVFCACWMVGRALSGTAAEAWTDRDKRDLVSGARGAQSREFG